MFEHSTGKLVTVFSTNLRISVYSCNCQDLHAGSECLGNGLGVRVRVLENWIESVPFYIDCHHSGAGLLRASLVTSQNSDL